MNSIDTNEFKCVVVVAEMAKQVFQFNTDRIEIFLTLIRCDLKPKVCNMATNQLGTELGNIYMENNKLSGLN